MTGWVPEPPVASNPPDPPTGALFNGLPAAQLSLSTAFEVAFKVLTKPTFMVPLLGVSVAVNAFLEAFVVPGLLDAIGFTPTGRPTIEDLNGLLGSFAVIFVVGIVGSLIVALYGQIWAAAASLGPFPTIDGTFELAARRWLSFLGAAIVSTLITLAVLAVLLVPSVLLISANPEIALLLGLAVIVPYLYVFSRISMITWLAADGHPIGASVRGSWQITKGGVPRIIGWSLATGLVIALISAGLSALLGRVPLVGSGIAQGIQLAMTYGAGVTLYRRTQAAAMWPALPVPQPAASEPPQAPPPPAPTPPDPGAPIG
jgi:hypothetical protein